ncbi:hypothetical protein WMY93_009748 [Mugilogobius chulae]|uniref:Uncharacterized protein n=1 Tax=Mugilogobius chulae TaxID=88201 RepID=A0AAW0PCL2_9GOBI
MTALKSCFLFCIFLDFVCAESLEAFVGQAVTIACNYDAKYYGKLAVCWGKGFIPNRGCANEVIRTDGTEVTSRASERYVLFGNLEDGDVSLTIRQLQETDSGTYGCRVDIPGWFNDHKHETLLNVVPARPNPPKVEPREVKEEAITVRWSPVFDGGRPVLLYRIDLKNKLAPWDTALRTELYDPSLTQVTLVDLRPAKAYNLRMFAVNSVGISESSNVITVTTKEAAPEGPPQEMHLVALSPRSIRVTWKAPRSDLRNGVVRSYRVSYREYNPADQQFRQWQYMSVTAEGNQTTKAPSVGTISPNTKDISAVTRTTLKTPTTTSAFATVWASTSSSFNLGSPEPPIIELKSVKEGVISLLWSPGAEGSSPITSFSLEYKVVNGYHYRDQTLLVQYSNVARNTVGKSKASNVLTLTVEEKGQQKDVSVSTLSTDTRAISAEDNQSGHLAAILVPLLLVLIIVAVIGTWQIRRIRQKKGTLSMWLGNGALRYRGAGSLQESL